MLVNRLSIKLKGAKTNLGQRVMFQLTKTFNNFVKTKQLTMRKSAKAISFRMTVKQQAKTTATTTYGL